MSKTIRCEKSGKFLKNHDFDGSSPVFLRLTENGAATLRSTAEKLNLSMAQIVERAMRMFVESLSARPVVQFQATEEKKLSSYRKTPGTADFRW